MQIGKIPSDKRVYNSKNPEEVWTDNPEEAEKTDKGLQFANRSKKDTGEAGQPSKINHGNFPPQIDALAGGVTISKAVQTTLISLAALRRLRFKGVNSDSETAARTAIAALGVAAIAYQYDMDYDLRSRCLLVPTHSPCLELLARDGSVSEKVSIDRDSANQILSSSAAYAKKLGIGWNSDNLRLKPSPKFCNLIRASRHTSSIEQPSE